MRSVRRVFTLLAIISLPLAASACAQFPDHVLSKAPRLAEMTAAGQALSDLPPPQVPVFVTVYEFDDLTGQHKPSENFAEFSRAVTQGGADILMDALYRAGDGNWFSVVERRRLQNLLRERQVIRATREQFQGNRAAPLPAMKFAGTIIEGGIIAYESDEVTGGAGARFLGVGASTQYRRDIVTVAMRAISVQDGRVLASVNTTKTIYSTLARADAFTFVSFDEILEFEAGISRNEPPQLAVRQAIELGVYALILEGSIKGLWSFADTERGQALVQRYQRIKSGRTEEELLETQNVAARS